MTRKTCVLAKNCQPRVTFDAPKPDTRTAFNKDGEKHGQREILESRDIRQVPNKIRVEVQSQNRDLLIRDVRTCLACPIFDHSEETRRCHSYFVRMISRTSSESDSSCNRVSNATDSVNGLISSKSSSLNKGAPLAFRRLPDSEGRIKGASPSFLDQERFHHGTSRVSSFGQTVCQHR